MVFLGLLLALAAYAAAVFVVNRMAQPTAGDVALRRQAAATGTALPVLSIMTWNLGYAALGQDADFKPDGGTTYLPATRELVAQNLDGIAGVLRAERIDVIALQEVTVSSYLNLNAPMLERLEAVLPDYNAAFGPDLVTKLVPPPFRLEHGGAIFSRARPAQVQSVPLPLEPGYWLGFIKKQYALLVTRIPIAGSTRQWVIANTHLSAYDDGDTRRAQIAAALVFAGAEFDKGNHVIIAGDWNLLLAPSTWPHTTSAKLLDWAKPFPSEILPFGWTVAIDASKPTVRQLDRAYIPGQNFTAIIDGFIVSPNVRVNDVRVIDLRFAFSDHQPVVATFRAIE